MKAYAEKLMSGTNRVIVVGETKKEEKILDKLQEKKFTLVIIGAQSSGIYPEINLGGIT